MVNIELKYNLVETTRKFIVAELSICKLGSSSVLLVIMLCDNKRAWCFHKIIFQLCYIDILHAPVEPP